MSLLSPDFRRHWIDGNRAGYHYLAHKYLGCRDGQLFLQAEPDANESWRITSIDRANSEPVSRRGDDLKGLSSMFTVN